MTLRLTFVRHGQSVANREGVVQGHLDSPLSEIGRRQVEALADAWHTEAAAFDHLVSSPLLRARQTAEILAARLQLSVQIDPLWMERDLGRGQGMPLTDFLSQSSPQSARSPFEPAFEGGESPWDLHSRAARALQALVAGPPGEYLIVSHGGILNAALRAVLGLSPMAQRAPRFHFANTGYARVWLEDNGSWTVRALVNPPDDAPDEADA